MSVKHIATKKFISAQTTGTAIAATDVFVTRDSSVKIFDGEKLDIQVGFDDQDVSQENTNPFNSFGFTLDSIGSGVAGTAPELGIFLKAAGGKEDVQAAEVIYTKEGNLNNVVGVDIESRAKEVLTGKDYLYRATNAIGQMGLNLSSSGKAEFIASGFIGDYILPVSAAMVEPDYGTQKDRLALPTNADNVLVFQLDGKNVCVSEANHPALWYAGGAERESLMGGCKSTDLVDGVNEGAVTFKETDWDTEFNPFEWMQDAHVFPYLVTIGTEPGKMISVSCARTMMLNVEDATIGRMSAKSSTLRFLDPLVLKFH